MDDDLQALKQQRELIRQHLAWLDRQIDSLEGPDRPAHPSPADESTTPAAPPPTAETTPAPQPAVAPPDLESDKILQEAIRAERSAGPAQASRMDDLTRAKVGCLLLFGLAVLGFLFFLFGLPYLMD